MLLDESVKVDALIETIDLDFNFPLSLVNEAIAPKIESCFILRHCSKVL